MQSTNAESATVLVAFNAVMTLFRRNEGHEKPEAASLRLAHGVLHEWTGVVEYCKIY